MPFSTSGRFDHDRTVAMSAQVGVAHRVTGVVTLDDGAKPGSVRRRLGGEVAERRQFEAGAHVALAIAEDRQVDRQHDRPEPGGDRPVHERSRDTAGSPCR